MDRLQMRQWIGHGFGFAANPTPFELQTRQNCSRVGIVLRAANWRIYSVVAHGRRSMTAIRASRIAVSAGFNVRNSPPTSGSSSDPV